MKYRPEIDGLRAIAVIPVILFHAGFAVFSGGFVGVDVFFVISGYLITTIILSELEQDRFSLLRFYERRARRILPALFLVMIVSLFLGWHLLLPRDMQDFSESLVAVSTFSSNFLFMTETAYWDARSELKPLLHTWSLSVEEQYYVLFPVFLMLMWCFRKRWVFGLLMAFAALSLIMAHIGTYFRPTLTFYLLPTRAWELAIGASVAFYFIYRPDSVQVLRSKKIVSESGSFLGLLCIFYSIFAFDEGTPFPSLYTLMPTVGTALLILFCSPRTIAGYLLGSKALVFIGLISYSAYLWHQPLFAYYRYVSFFEPNQWFFILLIGMVFLLAYVSWRFVEQPFRDKNFIRKSGVLWFSLVGSLFFIVVGVTGFLQKGFKQRDVYADLLIQEYEPDNRILQIQTWDQLRKLSNSNDYSAHTNEFDHKLWYDVGDSRQKLLLIGNSHSKDLYNVFLESTDVTARYQVARFGVQLRELVKNNREPGLFNSPNYMQADIVMIVSRYSSEDSAAMGDIVKRMKSDGKRVAIVKGIYEFYAYGIRNTADGLLQTKYLEQYKKGEITGAEVARLIDGAHYEQYSTRERIKQNLLSDDVIEAIGREHGDVLILDRMDYACNKLEKRCFSLSEKFNKYYYDYGHHSMWGVTFFANRIDQLGWLDDL